jgi:CBS domain-containing protein
MLAKRRDAVPVTSAHLVRLCGLAARAVAHGLQPFRHMNGEKHEGRRYLRKALGFLAAAAVRKLTSVARRLGAPSLATIPVSAAMLTALPVIKPSSSLEDVAELFIGGKNRELAVVEHGHPVRVVTRDDIATGLERRGPQASISDAPSHDVVEVAPSDSLEDVLEQLRAAPDSVAVVVDRGEAVGLLTYEKLWAYAAHAKLVA